MELRHQAGVGEYKQVVYSVSSDGTFTPIKDPRFRIATEDLLWKNDVAVKPIRTKYFRGSVWYVSEDEDSGPEFISDDESDAAADAAYGAALAAAAAAYGVASASAATVAGTAEAAAPTASFRLRSACLTPAIFLPRPGLQAPFFNELARGSPLDWNIQNEETVLYWRKSEIRFPSSPNVDSNIDRMLSFLSVRLGRNKSPVLTHLGSPVKHDDGWYRMHYLCLDDSLRMQLTREGWQLAWHGTKLEALFSILYHGGLRESRDETLGERKLTNAPGVYAFSDKLFNKADSYCRFVDLCGDGVFFACKLELLVNRDAAVKVQRKTDQWVQPASAVNLTAVWICVRRAAEMHLGSPVSPRWNPLLESNPTADRFRNRGEKRRHVIVFPLFFWTRSHT